MLIYKILFFKPFVFCISFLIFEMLTTKQLFMNVRLPLLEHPTSNKLKHLT